MSTGSRTIRVEFYGIPRLRAGVAEAIVELSGDSCTLADVLRVLAKRFPGMASECLRDDRLGDGFAVNIGGSRFVVDTQEVVRAGESRLVLSADAGG